MMMKKIQFLFFVLMTFLMPLGRALAQDGESAASPAGLAMLVLFLGIAGIAGVFVIHLGQSASEDD